VNVFINTDGAARPPDPGPAGAGYVILLDGDDGPRSVIGAVPLGDCGHHEAEYQAAIHGLRRARELGATSAILRTDSLVLVEQMNEGAEIRSDEILVVAERLRAEIDAYEAVEIVWVRRKENKAADLLSKVGLARAELVDPSPETVAG